MSPLTSLVDGAVRCKGDIIAGIFVVSVRRESGRERGEGGGDEKERVRGEHTKCLKEMLMKHASL